MAISARTASNAISINVGARVEARQEWSAIAFMAMAAATG
jgi:hypothetical protein